MLAFFFFYRRNWREIIDRNDGSGAARRYLAEIMEQVGVFFLKLSGTAIGFEGKWIWMGEREERGRGENFVSFCLICFLPILFSFSYFSIEN